jgi:hypothetical protein
MGLLGPVHRGLPYGASATFRVMSGPGPRPHSAFAAVLAGGLLGLGLGGCGGSGQPTKTKATTAATRSTAKHQASGGASVNSGPVRAALLGQNHHPVANRNWSYVVHVADAHGRPLSGTLETEFAFNGTVVGRDTPFIHSFRHGGFRENLKFPATAVGYPIELQVVVHTAAGSVTLDWPVMVRK